jgi:Protein of unknown function (DUF2911)
MKTKTSLLALAIALGVTATSFAQTPKVDFPAASPTSTLKQRVGLTDIEIVYSRPSVKGRSIFGGLVPYGEVWRTGANNATKIIFSTPVKINGAEIAAGTYALFTIPGADEWTIIINKGSAQLGAYKYSDKDDVVRVKAKPAKISEHVESFTIDINAISDESATMYLLWDDVAVPIKIEHELTSTLVPQIEAVMASDEKSKPYFQSAMFYYDHGQDLKKANEWVDAAIKQREWHNVVHLKAKILAKLGDKEGALVAAKRSLEMATKAKDAGYVKMNEDLISSLK